MQRFGWLLMAVLVLAACDSAQAPDYPPAPAPEALRTHGEEFRQQVVEVTDGVYVAIGFGIANAIMIEGEDGIIIVDTLESLDIAREVMALFRVITDKPVHALIYTHSHPDHILGAAAFVEPGQAVEVIAHETLARNAQQVMSVLQPIITRRSMFMYGNWLNAEERTNVGIGPFVALRPDSQVQMLPPTLTFSDRLELDIAGVQLVLEHAPGETDDHLFVWLPERGVLMPGDNIYKAFPNLYTLRGTSYRDPRAWADSLDRMRQLEASFLVPSHGQPVTGEAAVAEALTVYRDGIRYVYDQTVRLMNAGLTADDIAARLRLPPHLASSPWLQGFYGRPDWSARSIYQGLLGWYDSNPTHLNPLPPADRAQRVISLAGGDTALMNSVEEALAAEDFAWVLELTDHLLRVFPAHSGARDARISALRALAAAESNPNARHYYLTTADELAGHYRVPDRLVEPDPAMLASLPLDAFFDGMEVALDGEAAWDVQQRIAFEFPDLRRAYTLEVRRGVTERLPGVHPEADIHVQIDSLAFKQLLAGQRNPALALAVDFDFQRGGRLGLARFLRLFGTDLELE